MKYVLLLFLLSSCVGDPAMTQDDWELEVVEKPKFIIKVPTPPDTEWKVIKL